MRKLGCRMGHPAEGESPSRTRVRPTFPDLRCLRLLAAAASLAAAVAALLTASPAPAQEPPPEPLPYYLQDRGRGIPTSLFGTYIRGGDFLVYPFYEYYINEEEPYRPEELGYEGETEYEGRSEQHEYLIFLGYGFTDSFAVEFEAALYTNVTIERDPEDDSGTPPRFKEEGLGDVESQLRWRWFGETENRPELFSFFEIVFPLQKDKHTIGVRDWEFFPGIGLIKGFTWGTLTTRASLEYTLEDEEWETGEWAIEYLKRVSDTWRFVVSYEAEGDEVATIVEVQYFFTPDTFLKLNNGFGMSRAAADYAPEVGVMFVF